MCEKCSKIYYKIYVSNTGLIVVWKKNRKNNLFLKQLKPGFYIFHNFAYYYVNSFLAGLLELLEIQPPV